MNLEQKIQEIFDECTMKGKLCPRPEECPNISCTECRIELILAAISQPQQRTVIEFPTADLEIKVDDAILHIPSKSQQLAEGEL